MMIAIYLLLSAAVAVSTLAARSRRTMHLAGSLYYLIQALFALWLLAGGGYGRAAGTLFEFDAAGTLFYILLAIVSFWVFHHSETYLSECDQRQTRTYFALAMLLTTAIAGAYFASNIAVTWIFLEATTLCSAGIIYHRRTAQTLEAAWKYVFVCSTGIAMAYLGILLLAATTKCESLSYEAVAAVAAQGNPLYLKIAFLLILCGYSCKMELFPLYTVGVDANFAAPAPASALISTGLVNAGFLAILRVYRLLAGTEVFGWAKSVLLLTGVLSLAIGALFLRRTNNYKRFSPTRRSKTWESPPSAWASAAPACGPRYSMWSATRSSRAACSCRWAWCARCTTATASTVWATTSASTAWEPSACWSAWSW